ncbi:MAG: peptidoglycan DD-metalloendopeptidase family protein [Cyanobacteria bacterium P01_D01_bin.105]
MSAPQHNAPEGRHPQGETAINEAIRDEVTGSEAIESQTAVCEEATEKNMSQQPNRPSLGYKLQRCWFIALGLVGSFGFIVSQVSFARAESSFLINDYATQSESGNFSVADTTFSPSGSLASADFNPPSAGTLPGEVLGASSAPATDKTLAVSASAATPEPAASASSSEAAPIAAAAPSITIEIEQAQPAEPEVTAVAPPSFVALTSSKKPAAKKVARRRNPILGMIEASAFAAPLSDLANASGNRSASAPTTASAVRNQTSTARAAAARTATERTAAADTAETVSVVEIANRRAGTLVVAAGEGATSGVLGASPLEVVSDSAPATPDVLPTSPSAVSPEAAASTATEPVPDIAEIAPGAPVQPTEIVPASLPEGMALPEEYNSIFVDPTDYSVGATESPDVAAPDVVISDQSTGCEFTVENGQGVPAGACNAAPAPLGAPEYDQAPIANQPGAPAANGAQGQPAPVASAPAVNVGPVSFSTAGIRFNSSTTAAGREYLNRSVRPMVNLQAAEQFIFPLAIPSPITSLFGFRVHPVTGQYRFHAGTDIGAEYGTPVLAVQDGTVVSADRFGGYGLMVVLNHAVDNTQLESRYAHLSDILVEPGTAVKKGDVIGLVGSTGVSTGPHLHFEMLQNTADGWVLVNADSLVQNSLSKLVQALNNPMQAMNFSLADLNLNLGSIRRTPAPSQPGGNSVNQPQPGQNGIPFRPAQPNAS